MGYQVTFAPTEEKMKDYKPWNENSPYESHTRCYKQEIISYCMKNTDNVTVSQKIKQLSYLLNCIYLSIEQDEKQYAYTRWKEDKKHELYYCGWEYSRPSDFEKEDIVEQYIDQLLVFADMVATPNFFENEENFYHKYKKVEELVDGFEELAQGILIHNIINDLEEFKVNDESDENS